MLLLLLLLPSLLALSEGGELGKVVSVCGSEGGEEGEFAGGVRDECAEKICYEVRPLSFVGRQLNVNFLEVGSWLIVAVL